MNFNEIVFIIGAGAHVPYGFPTGPELKEILRRMFYPDPEYPLKLLCGKTYYYDSRLRQLKDSIIEKLKIFYKDLNGTTFNPGEAEKELKRFVDKLLNSAEPTIDSFLAKRTEEASIGKLIIGVLIRHFELQNPIRSSKDNWLQTLANTLLDKNLNDPFETLKNIPGFITFNYDRLLEEFFFQRLKSLWKFRDDQASDFINRLNIHHIYNKIGDKTLEEVEKVGLGEHSQIISESKNIDIVPMERSNHDLDMDSSLKEIIRKSNRIYFLGFGFDYLNIRQLFTNPFEIDLFKSKLLVSTNVGLKKDNFNSINQFFNRQIRFFEGENVDSLELLTNKTPLQNKY